MLYSGGGVAPRGKERLIGTIFLSVMVERVKGKLCSMSAQQQAPNSHVDGFFENQELIELTAY